MTGSDGPAQPASLAISNAVVKILHEYTGRGPTKARTIITDSLVTCLLADSLTRGELSLVKDGKAALVRDVRRHYQETMRRELVAAVEKHTGRNVIAFMSDNHIDPDYAIEAFILEPPASQTDWG